MSRGLDDAFAEFVSSRSGRLLAQAEMLCGDREQARDIVQTALMRAYPRWRQINAEDPYGYVAKSVANAAIDSWRRAHRRHERLTATPPEIVLASLDSSLEDRDVLRGALGALTEHERVAVVLRYLDDRSEFDVAALLRVSPGTVKSTCHRALHKMRVTLEGVGDAPVAAPDVGSEPSTGKPGTRG